VNIVLIKSAFITLVITSQVSCTYGVWDLPEIHPRVADVHPARVRFTYDRPSFETKVIASQITIAVKETRQDLVSETDELPVLGIPNEGETVKVALHRSFIEEAQDRIRYLINGQGPQLTLTVVVRAISATQIRDIYRLDGTCELRLSLADEEPFVAIEVRDQITITAPPYDATELDEVHRAIGLRFIDKVFASDRSVDRINLQIRAATIRPVEDDQYI
jgi:hypothetical protein